jgi:hypothetical protein
VGEDAVERLLAGVARGAEDDDGRHAPIMQKST